MRRLAVTALPLIAAALLAGCGSESDATFDESDFGITFTYPDDFQETSDVNAALGGGGEATATHAVALDEDNLILVQKYALNFPISESELPQARREIEAVFRSASIDAEGGEEVEFAGLPGLEYEAPLPTPPDGHSRFVFLFDDSTEYLINCQSMPEQRDEIAAACDQALGSIELK